jgi:MFS family permease
MTAPRSLSAFAIVFAVAYAVAYVIAVQKNLALFTYHPQLVEFDLGVQKPRDGPAMYWYGWMATAGIAACAAGLLAGLLPERVTRRLWSGLAWVVPLGVMLAFAFFLRSFFLR